MKIFSQGCSLDCYDLCKFLVYKENEKVIKIVGDKSNNFTDGFICKKGTAHIERLYHKDRLKHPLLKVGDEFKEISWDRALNLIAEKLQIYKSEFSSNSIIHYAESGSGAVLKGIEDVFFNFYGGITTSIGSTCWGAGSAATDFDFGTKKTSSIEDLRNSKTIIFWGRNPYNTSIHLFKKTLDAKKSGSLVVTIDPRKNESSKISDIHVDITPSTDGALAMAITKYLINENLLDFDFIDKYTLGAKEYISYLNSLDMNFLLNECNINLETIKKLASLFIEKKVSIYIGYGMQKYSNGGNSVRAINALMALTGNIGEEGCGSFYANRYYPKILNLDPFNSDDYALNKREFQVSDFIKFIDESVNLEKNPIKAIFITKCNPLNQFPHLNKTIESFKKIEFKVCFDMFMTETAKHCDLIIPVTNTLESEDIIYSSMHNPVLLYNEKVVEPSNILLDEFYFFRKLAEIMNIKEYPQVDKKEYINLILKPLNITIENLKEKEFIFTDNDIAWKDKVFSTPSGKIEIYSKKALESGNSPYPIYVASEKPSVMFPIRLISAHYKDSLFSQHFIDVEGKSEVFVSENIFNKFQDRKYVELQSIHGKIECQIKCDMSLKDNLAYMYIGWHHRHGNPNFLSCNGSSEMGGQITYNNTFIKII